MIDHAAKVLYFILANSLFFTRVVSCYSSHSTTVLVVRVDSDVNVGVEAVTCSWVGTCRCTSV